MEKREFILKGLGCANCAAKMEHKINELEGIGSANINFITKTLTLEIEETSKTKDLIAEANNIIKGIEGHVTVIEKQFKKVKSVEPKAEAILLEEKLKEQKAENEEENSRSEVIRLIVGAVIFGIAAAFKLPGSLELLLYLLSYVLVGGEVILRALKNIKRGQIFDENFLMGIATIGAFAIGEYPEGVAVMLFYQVGEMFQDMAVDHSRKSITALMDIRPDFANLKKGDEIVKVSPEEVSIGDVIIVKPGEKVPLDGKVISGSSMIDTSALTGESVPREVSQGDSILGGVINKNGLLTIEVEKEFGDSTVAKILDLVQNASSKKAPTENFITKFARYYTPVVVFAALALAVLPPMLIHGASFSQWLYRALSFLVVSCPCALVISIPLGFFGGIGGASKNGILIKGGNYLEALNNVETVVFDKTGTLTKGVFKVTEVKSEKGFTQEEILAYAAYAESFSNHPIALSILKAYGKEIEREAIKNYEELSGHGIKALVENKEILTGNYKLMEKENIKITSVETAGTVVYIAVDKQYAGYIVISDELKEDSLSAIKALKAIGVKKTIMLTGDNRIAALKVANELNIDEFYAELLPDEKVNKVEYFDSLKTEKGKLLFVGDGINDAPVLARADIGIAMGGVGSDAAIEAADVVIMTDEPSKIAAAIKIAKNTRKIVMQNIIFALGVKAIILILVALGLGTMWEAVFGDVGVALLAVLNSMRAMKTENL